jgi:hypothetical protein
MAASGVERTTVLVVGGGPAGLAAAAELSLHGVGCVVIEPRAEVSHRRPRAKTTSIRTMEHLRRWGVADALRRAAPLPVAWSQRVTFCESLAGARITDFDGAFGLTADRDDRFAEAGQQVPQPVVEEVLREHLRGRPGTELRLGHAATSLTQDSGGVTVAVRDAAGAGYPIRARYVLGCDGAGGVVREQTGACYLGRSDPRPNFNLVFRAPGLDTHLGPAVQYWVVGAAIVGLIGRLDLSGYRTARRCTTGWAPGSPSSVPGLTVIRAPPRWPGGRAAAGYRSRSPKRRPPTLGRGSSCSSGPTSTLRGGPPTRPTWTSRRPRDSARCVRAYNRNEPRRRSWAARNGRTGPP